MKDKSPADNEINLLLGRLAKEIDNSGQKRESDKATLSNLPLVVHICISEMGSIGSGNVLLPVRCQAFTWTNAD